MKNKRILRATLALAAFGLVLWSCAKLQDTLPTSPDVSAHPAGWGDSTSAAFHATYLRGHGMHLDSCTTCHGDNFRGGTARSCAGSGCHNTTKYLFHPDAWTDTLSAQFHGTTLRTNGFHFDSCRVCHGQDFTGGVVKATCSKSGCHVEADNGPLACYNCHGDRVAKLWNPPRAVNGSTDENYAGVGQHAGHLYDTTLTVRVFQKCNVCHVVPATYDAPSHVDGPKATITIGDTLAFFRTNTISGYRYSDTLPTYTPAPRYDPVTQTCSNVYCHGYFRNGNVTNAPKWTGSEQDACGTCHGNPLTHNPAPGGTHAKWKDGCDACHGDVVDANNNIINRSLHIDGKIEENGITHEVW